MCAYSKRSRTCPSVPAVAMASAIPVSASRSKRCASRNGSLGLRDNCCVNRPATTRSAPSAGAYTRSTSQIRSGERTGEDHRSIGGLAMTFIRRIAPCPSASGQLTVINCRLPARSNNTVPSKLTSCCENILSTAHSAGEVNSHSTADTDSAITPTSTARQLRAHWVTESGIFTGCLDLPPEHQGLYGGTTHRAPDGSGPQRPHAAH